MYLQRLVKAQALSVQRRTLERGAVIPAPQATRDRTELRFRIDIRTPALRAFAETPIKR